MAKKSKKRVHAPITVSVPGDDPAALEAEITMKLAENPGYIVKSRDPIKAPKSMGGHVVGWTATLAWERTM